MKSAIRTLALFFLSLLTVVVFQTYCGVPAFATAPVATVEPAAEVQKDSSKEATKEKEEDGEKGFVPLFDGKTLKGWQGSTKGYVVDDGAIYCKRKGGGNLYTKNQYADFDLKFEFQLTRGANNGLGIRTPLKGDPAYAGMELQILDNSFPGYKKLKPYQFHASVYGVVPAKRGHQKPVGEWNSQEVIARGSHIKIILNGVVVLDADVIKASTPKPIDGHQHPGLKREKGYICFCGHGARVGFRNIRIKVLEPKKKDAKTKNDTKAETTEKATEDSSNKTESKS